MPEKLVTILINVHFQNDKKKNSERERERERERETLFLTTNLFADLHQKLMKSFPDPSLIQFLILSVGYFLCYPADRPTNRQRRNITLLVEVINC